MKTLYKNAKDNMRRDSKKYWYDEDGNEYELPMRDIHNTKALEIIEDKYIDVIKSDVYPSDFLLNNNWIRVWVNNKTAQIDVYTLNKKIKDTILEIIDKHKIKRICFENKTNSEQDGFYNVAEFTRDVL